MLPEIFKRLESKIWTTIKAC